MNGITRKDRRCCGLSGCYYMGFSEEAAEVKLWLWSCYERGRDLRMAQTDSLLGGR